MPIVPCKTRRNIADEYGFSVRTLYRKLQKNVPEIAGRELITAAYQKLIYDRLGWPAGVDARGYTTLR